MKKTLSLISIFALLILPVVAKNKLNAKKGPKPIRIDIGKDKVGGESSRFLSVVGNWAVTDDGGCDSPFAPPAGRRCPKGG